MRNALRSQCFTHTMTPNAIHYTFFLFLRLFVVVLHAAAAASFYKFCLRFLQYINGGDFSRRWRSVPSRCRRCRRRLLVFHI